MKIGVWGSPSGEDKLQIIKNLFAKLEELGAAVYVPFFYYDILDKTFDYRPKISGIIEDEVFDLDIVLSVGGDGTFLRTALKVNRQRIPILGINTGRLGFLADVGSEQIDETLEDLFRGHYRIEERTLLSMEADEDAFEGFNYALNEVAVLKRDTSSMITIHTFLNDEYLASYRADGLVIATPTGSTAYSMSVNGPILLPNNSNFILSPVSPHSLNVRPVVIPDDYTISLTVESRTNSFLVALDGRSGDISVGTGLKINKADFTALIVKRFNHTFYQTLREKLMWGADARG